MINENDLCALKKNKTTQARANLILGFLVNADKAFWGFCMSLGVVFDVLNLLSQGKPVKVFKTEKY